MSPKGQTARLLIGVFLLTSVSFSFSSCGGTSFDLAGGGVSGTGVSTGAITDFGSVFMNGMEFFTDGNVGEGFVTKKTFMGMDNSSMNDRDLFRVGMVVTIHHGPNDNNAQQIEYQDNLQGPIAAKIPGVENTVTILGHTVVVGDADFDKLNLNGIAEVSGFVDSTGRIRASYIAMVPCSMMMGRCTASEFEVKGYVSGLTSSGFRLGPLPRGAGTTVAVSFSPAVGAGLAEGMYVQVVTTDPQLISGGITATRIGEFTPRTVFPEKAVADLEGLVTTPPSGSGNVLSFAVEGKPVQADGNTQFAGGTAADLRPDVRLQVQGTENGGVLSAGKIIFR
jgi:cytoskeletal protein CcmA (bactofilin family)